MWVWRVLIFHKTATGGGCKFGLQRFLASVGVWQKRFPSHHLHGSMLEPPSCVCGSMYKLLLWRETILENKDSAMIARARATGMAHSSIIRPTPTQHQPPPVKKPHKQKAQSKQSSVMVETNAILSHRTSSFTQGRNSRCNPNYQCIKPTLPPNDHQTQCFLPVLGLSSSAGAFT
jgi:hypothetical protein